MIVCFFLCCFLLFLVKNLHLSQHRLHTFLNKHVIHDLICFLFSYMDNPWGIVWYGCYMDFTNLHHKVRNRYIILQYLERKPHQLHRWSVSCGSSNLVELAFRNFSFWRRGKPENPKKNPRWRREATLLEGIRSEHCAILAPYVRLDVNKRNRNLYGHLVNEENENCDWFPKRSEV